MENNCKKVNLPTIDEMLWNSNRESEIKRLSEFILNKVKGSKIYGVEFDANNEFHLLVAGYLMAKNENYYNKTDI
jgi:hypothetical protein